jgi:glyoxylase-like metal-dependent hydrolase (beta-lactamase superfamily II)
VTGLADILPLDLADIFFPASHPLAGQQGVVLAFVIRHPDGPLLYDTGMGTGHALIEELYRPVVRAVEAALDEHGLQPEDIVAVANSHLHFDHCGGNRLFGGVPIYVQAADYRMAHETTFTILEWVDAPGVGYVQLEGDAEIAPGVRVLATPGHTPGHQSLLVETGDGPAILAGQAIYSLREYEHILRTGTLLPGDEPPDPTSYLASAHRLIDARPRRVYFSHDRAVWDRR